MKRHPSLAALSRDHHHALVLSQSLKHDAPERLTRALPHQPSERLAHVRRRFDAELEPHFTVEETVLLPASRAHGEPLASHAARVDREHHQLRTLLADAVADASLSDRLHAFAELLEAHVRFEEREWFPSLESELGSDALASLATRLPA